MRKRIANLESSGGGAVSSVFGRTGAVVAAANDYTEAQLSVSDVTTNNVSASAHGFAPKITDTAKFLKGDGTWATPAGGGDWVYLGSTTITGSAAATITLASLATGYKTLHFEIHSVPPASTPDAGYVDFTFNADSGNHYSTQTITVENTTISGVRQTSAAYGEFGNLASTVYGCFVTFDVQQHAIGNRILFAGKAGLATKFIELFGSYDPEAVTDITSITCNWRSSGAGLYWNVGTVIYAWGAK